MPRQQEGVSSGTTAGYAQDMDIMLYPNALITVRPQELPEDFDPMRMHPEHTLLRIRNIITLARSELTVSLVP